jgi:hypothetical protein
VFESLLSVAQTLNLSIDVLEKQSGFMQFKNAALSPSQLDQYCRYPAVKPNTTQPWSTFVNWNQRSMGAGAGSVRGSVSISILLTQLSENSSKLKIHSTWTAGNLRETNQCTSLTVLEKEMEAALRAHWVSPPAAPTPPVLGVGTKLFTTDGAPFGTVMDISGSTVRVSHVKGGTVTVTTEQALSMMQK